MKTTTTTHLIFCLLFFTLAPLALAQNSTEQAVRETTDAVMGKRPSPKGASTQSKSGKKTRPSATHAPSPTPAPIPEASPTPAESATGRAAEPTPSPTPPDVTPEAPIEKTPEKAFSTRGGFGVSLAGTVLSLPIPTKYGLGVSWVRNPKWTYELSYFFGSYGVNTQLVSIGSFKESLINADARWFPMGGTFNLMAGLGVQSYDLRLGDDIVSYVGGFKNDLLSTSTLGLQVALGNRISYRSFTLGVDWLTLNFPFLTLKNETGALDYVNNQDSRGKVESALRVMRYLPTGSLLKVSVGYVF